MREYTENTDISYDTDIAKEYAGYMLEQIASEREEQI